MTDGQVYPLFGPPVRKSYRSGVARCLREIKARHHLNNVVLAEYLGCSAETIANAEAEENDLSAVTLLRIAYVFGEESISPVRSLYLCKNGEPKTLSERLDDFQAQFNALRKEVGA